MVDIDEELEEESEMTDDQVEEMVRVLDKEEKEMDEAPEEGDEEENKNLVRDVEKIEEAMEKEEVLTVLKMVKPVHQVLYKVGTPQSSVFMLPFFCVTLVLVFTCFLFFVFKFATPFFFLLLFSFLSYYLTLRLTQCSIYSCFSSRNWCMRSRTQLPLYYLDGLI